MHLYLFISDQKCLTNSDGPQKNVICVITWKFKGKLYNDCTTDEDPDGKLWCSTKTSSDLEHIGGQGNWGYCEQSCFQTDIVSGT